MQEYYDEGPFGGNQFTSLDNIITQFMISYVGKDKIIPKVKKIEVGYHAQRAMQELSFDTFKSCRAQEITVPSTLQMILPQDYVNYTKVSWVDNSGVKHPLYPTSRTSNPTNPYQNSDGTFYIKANGTLTASSDQLVLDGQYDNILVGMNISAPWGGGTTIFPGAMNDVVKGISTSGGITTITMATTSPVTYTGDLPIEFRSGDGSVIQEPDSQILLSNLSTTTQSRKIEQSPGSTTVPEVGMRVSHEYFPTDTVVTDVDASSSINYIFVSRRADTTSTGYTEEMTFTSSNSNSETWKNYKSTTQSESNTNNYVDDRYWPLDGSRYGLDPQHAQANGSFYIDCSAGRIHFSSNINGKTVVLDYISDGFGSNNETQIHKFAEEAMYKWIAHAILATKSNTPEYLVARFKKEKFAETRKAKLRLSNIKLEEITQILRGKSKHIKH